jgi:cytochrome c
MIRLFGPALAVLAGFCSGAAAEDGAALFEKQCRACHTLSADEPRRQGPPLNGIIGRTAGKVDGFAYSNGLKQADWAWDEARLDDWLANPKSVFADTYMMYKQDDAAVRGQIITFLKTVTE